MPVYQYQAIARNGRNVRGVIDADSAAAARRKLRDQQLYPTQVKEGASQAEKDSPGRVGGRVSPRDVAMMTRQLAVLLQAGMSLAEALHALTDQTTNPRLRKHIYGIRDKVSEGVGLADALRAHPRVFGELYVNMVSAGEASGTLEQVLQRLAEILDRQIELNGRVMFAMLYPALMALVGTSVITFLMVFVVPRVTSLFEKQQRTLPTITQILIVICDFVKYRWWIGVVIVVVGYILWRAWVARPEGRRKWDAFKLRLPLIRGLYIRILSARFSRTLGTMLQSGLTMMTALDVVKSVLNNRILEELMDDIKADVRRGRDLSVPLRESGKFPPLLIHMTELGQRSGELETMMLRIADTYDGEVQVAVDGLVRLLEPLMIVIMAVFVGFLVISILLPIMQISSGIK